MKEFDPASFRKEGHKVVDRLADYLENIISRDSYPVLPDTDPEDLYLEFQKKLGGKNKQDLLEIIEEFITSSNHLHHPGYIGHQCTSPLPYSALTHLTAGLLNNGSAVYEMGPANTAMERAVLKHFSAILGYNDNAEGLLTHGGSLGNLTALLAARQAKTNYNIWEEGVNSNEVPAFIVSEQSHYSISRNLKIMGLGNKSTVPIPVTENFTIRTDFLEETLYNAKTTGVKIIGVVANACSTATGSYDDIDTIADFCEKHDLWLHIDGAHGMGAIMSNKYKHLVKGVERADSVIIDFHKMFLITGLNTAVIFKDGDKSYETFAQKATYLFQKTHEKEWYNSAKRSLECTKSSMGFHAYTMFRLYGDDFFGSYIDKVYDLARKFNNILNEHADFESVTSPEANIVCFRYIGKSSLKDQNELNRLIRTMVIKRGKFFIVQAELCEKVWLRVTLINPFTLVENLQELLEEVTSCANDI